jgi:hypothetical protein
MSAEDDTWEPRRHVMCVEIIQEFEKEWDEVEQSASVMLRSVILFPFISAKVKCKCGTSFKKA